MEKKAVNNQLKLAACFFLLSVVLRGVSVEACQQEDEDCSSLACCEGLECVEVSAGVFQCEPECCEEHADHSCKAHERECCDSLGLVCVCEASEGECKQYTKNLRDVCNPQSDLCARRAECVDLDGDGTSHCQCKQTKGCTDDCECCVNAKCTVVDPNTNDTECICNKQEDDTCDPNACVPECCERECVQVAIGDFRCKTV